MSEDSSEMILKMLQEKAVLKMHVCEQTAAGFRELKKALAKLQDELKGSAKKVISKNVSISFNDKNDHEAEFNIIDDTVVFLLHTNVFTFENNHEVWKSSYVKEDNSRSYCGKIYVYNFLSDSFKYNRTNDIGYLIARIFINKENHFFVEGKRQLGFLYNDFSTSEFNAEAAQKVAESALLYSLDFDPYIPPYNNVSQVSVQEIIDTNIHSKIPTGKRLGFRFEADKGENF